MDTSDNEILHLTSISHEEFQTLKEIVLKLQRLEEKYSDLEKRYNKTKEYIKILAEKEGAWCDICEKVLDEYEIKRCNGKECYIKICDKNHISFYDSYEGEVSFCSEVCMNEYERNYNDFLDKKFNIIS